MKLVTFSIAALEQTKGFARIVESVPTPAAHAVGVASGATGIALWTDWAHHLTVFAGLIVAFLAILGGSFYAAYWGLKMIQEWRKLRAPVPPVIKSDETDE